MVLLVPILQCVILSWYFVRSCYDHLVIAGTQCVESGRVSACTLYQCKGVWNVHVVYSVVFDMPIYP